MAPPDPNARTPYISSRRSPLGFGDYLTHDAAEESTATLEAKPSRAGMLDDTTMKLGEAPGEFAREPVPRAAMLMLTAGIAGSVTAALVGLVALALV